MSVKTFVVDSGSVTRLLKNWWVIDSGSIARKLKKVWVIDSGSIARLVFNPAIIAISSPGSLFSSGTGTVTTATTFVSASGGDPPYVSYAWSWLSGGSGITILGPSSSATAFRAHILSGDDFSGTAQCIVTDSVGDTGIATCFVEISSP